MTNNRLRHPAHRLTSTGYYVSGVQRHSDHVSGRVVETPQGKWMEPAQWAEWFKNGVAINHNFGDLIDT